MNIPLLFQNHKNIDDLNEKEIIKCIQILSDELNYREEVRKYKNVGKIKPDSK